MVDFNFGHACTISVNASPPSLFDSIQICNMIAFIVIQKYPHRPIHRFYSALLSRARYKLNSMVHHWNHCVSSINGNRTKTSLHVIVICGRVPVILDFHLRFHRFLSFTIGCCAKWQTNCQGILIRMLLKSRKWNAMNILIKYSFCCRQTQQPHETDKNHLKWFIIEIWNGCDKFLATASADERSTNSLVGFSMINIISARCDSSD